MKKINKKDRRELFIARVCARFDTPELRKEAGEFFDKKNKGGKYENLKV